MWQGRREHSRHLLGMEQLEAGLVHVVVVVNWEGGAVEGRKEASLPQD